MDWCSAATAINKPPQRFLSKPNADALQEKPGLTHPVDREKAETCRLTGSGAFPKTEPRVLSGQTQGKDFLLWPMSLSERRNSCDPDPTGNDCTRCEAIQNRRPQRAKTNPAIKNVDRRGLLEPTFQHFPFLLPTRRSPSPAGSVQKKMGRKIGDTRRRSVSSYAVCQAAKPSPTPGRQPRRELKSNPSGRKYNTETPEAAFQKARLEGFSWPSTKGREDKKMTEGPAESD